MAIETDILQQLQRSAMSVPGWSSLGDLLSSSRSPTGVHLAVLVEPYLEYILQHKKTVESRFSMHCIAPYRRIVKDDVVLLKATAGPVVGCFRAAWVECLELDEERLTSIRLRYSEAICADDAFWYSRTEKRYVTLVGVKQPQHLPPVRIAKSDRRGWIVLRSARQTVAQLSLL